MSPARPASSAGLRLEGLAVRFGGVLAVDGVDLEAPPGQITGLIGPNGAGKTTTFNACSGLLSPSAGRVYLDGTDMTGAGPAARARRGLGRTFQRMELFTSLTVAENVALGREAGQAGSKILAQFLTRAAERRATADAAEEALELCGIAHLAGAAVASLSTGQRRLVELARTLAGAFHLLLLDEPSSGLDNDETQAFGQVLRDVVDARGSGILLVEHDMSLVMDICEYVYVLDFGQLIFSGTPEEVVDSEVVREAYLGAGVV
jgi:ABC-type branched-subunit amino acid transport system ATPase component